jgi:excisionase family DNA binding protein
MHRRLQLGMRENPASSRRHGSRVAVHEKNQASPMLSPGDDHPYACSDASAHAALHHAARGGERDNAARHSALLVGPHLPENALHGFEPLIDSCEAAKLLGNIHVKTLQRYARHRRVPGYQIGGHWYFRASELDSWLRSQINSLCHPCRLQEKSDGT